MCREFLAPPAFQKSLSRTLQKSFSCDVFLPRGDEKLALTPVFLLPPALRSPHLHPIFLRPVWGKDISSSVLVCALVFLVAVDMPLPLVCVLDSGGQWLLCRSLVCVGCYARLCRPAHVTPPQPRGPPVSPALRCQRSDNIVLCCERWWVTVRDTSPIRVREEEGGVGGLLVEAS